MEATILESVWSGRMTWVCKIEAPISHPNPTSRVTVHLVSLEALLSHSRTSASAVEGRTITRARRNMNLSYFNFLFFGDVVGRRAGWYCGSEAIFFHAAIESAS